MEGWIKLHRQVLDNGWLQNPSLWTFWTYCLLKARHDKGFAMVGYQRVELEPGQFIFGREKAAQEIGLSERQIRTSISHLKSTGNLTIKATNKFSVITVVNWDTYQSNEEENDQQNDQQNAGKRPAGDHKQECKKEKKKHLSPNSDHATFIRWWCYAYQLTAGKPYLFGKGKDGKLVKELLQASEDRREVIAAACYFLTMEADWIKGARDLAMFRGQFNKIPNWQEMDIDNFREAGLLPPSREIDFDAWLSEVTQ